MVFLTSRLTRVHNERTAGNINHSVGECFIQRNSCFTETADTGLRAERGLQDFADGDGDVFHGVVHIDVSIASSFDGEINKRVLGQRRKHVIVKRHRGVNVGLSGAVQVHFNNDAGFARDAFHPGATATQQFGRHEFLWLCGLPTNGLAGLPLSVFLDFAAVRDLSGRSSILSAHVWTTISDLVLLLLSFLVVQDFLQ